MSSTAVDDWPYPGLETIIRVTNSVQPLMSLFASALLMSPLRTVPIIWFESFNPLMLEVSLQGCPTVALSHQRATGPSKRATSQQF